MAANATRTTKKTSTARKSSTTPKSRPATPRAAQRNATESAVAYVRQTAERAVNVPVGAALAVADSVKPYTDEATREKELKSLRTQVNRELNKLDRRGGQARRKLQTRVRTQRTRVERELKQRRNRVEKTVRQNRVKAEKAVKERVGARS